jgi:alpha-tubulin suppressor-like RCC1 family protein
LFGGVVDGAPPGTFLALAVGDRHACAIATDGALQCWGDDGFNQLDGIPAGSFARKGVSGGGAHTCMVGRASLLSCWGSDQFGQLDHVPSGTFTAVSAGADHTCALATAGAISCWGDDSIGQLDGIPTGTFTAISAGDVHTCAIATAGTISCWGANTVGQLNGIPTGTFTAVSAGGGHTCALSTFGFVTCWGDNDNGQSTVPSGSYLAVAAGGFHTCAIRTDATLKCWGRGTEGETTPPAGTFQAISAGEFHTCAISSLDAISCWGDDSSHQLDGIPQFGTFGPLSAGGSHTCAMESNDRTMACWGDNSAGQFGTAPTITSPSPPAPFAGVPYKFTVTGTGSPAPAFFVLSGSLPPGVSLGTAGKISGTPSGSGTFSFAVGADNGVGQAFQSVSWTVGSSPTVSVSDVDTPEKGSGTHNMGFKVSLSASPASTASVNFATSDGTAMAGSDYTAVNQSLTWNPGDALTKTVNVPITGDNRREGNETVKAKLSSALNLSISDANATGTIIDEEGRFFASITDTFATEGNAGTKNVPVSVNLAVAPGPGGQPVSVDVAATGGTATQGTDYTFTPTTVTWNPGDPASKTVNVAVIGDTTSESNETVVLTLSNASHAAVIADTSATVTIVNDDGTAGATPKPALSVADLDVLEHDSGTTSATIPVSLSSAPSSAVSVTLALTDVTTDASDHGSLSTTTLSWNPGDPVVKNVTVPIVGDTLKEGNETFKVVLSAPTGATLGDSSGTVAIIDEEGRFFVSVADAFANEGTSGTSKFGVNVTLSAKPATGQTVQVTLTQTGGTATSGVDYVAVAPTTVSWGPSAALTQTVFVTVNGDTTAEPNETIVMTLSAPSQGTVIVDTTSTSTIVNDD